MLYALCLHMQQNFNKFQFAEDNKLSLLKQLKQCAFAIHECKLFNLENENNEQNKNSELKLPIATAAKTRKYEPKRNEMLHNKKMF